MRRIYPESIGNVLRGLLADTETQQHLDERKAISLWPVVMGDYVADMCGRPFFSTGGVMSVRVASAPLRHELMMHRSAIIKHINDTIGKPIVAELRFIG